MRKPFGVARLLSALAMACCAGMSVPAVAGAVYTNDFERAEPGDVPSDFLVLDGNFAVRSDGTNRFLELPGAPLDSFAVQFGPAESENVAVTARVFGTGRGRRAPVFGVGLGGVSGYKLQVAPAKKALELLKDQEVKASAPFEWKTETWTWLRLQVRKLGPEQWHVGGKAWTAGEPEPKEWQVTLTERDAPPSGRPSVLGSPFSGTPIRYDDLRVETLSE
ncbi:MAG: hypothetical protein RMK20_04570 [Verrucomicrobiales bacterium]|nr:hypothetical protein [Verrucomicrobiales bacterium]